MVTGIMAFFGAYLLTWPALIVLFFLGVLFEHNNHRGFAVFIGLISIAISYFVFDVPLKIIAAYAAGYLVIGLLWSFWRYKRFVEMALSRIKASGKSDAYMKAAVENLAPSNQLLTITAWIIIWPFSAVENVVGDVLNMIQTLVTKFFKGVYNKIYTSLVAQYFK